MGALSIGLMGQDCDPTPPTDANNNVPTSTLGMTLWESQRTRSGHFEIFYNLPNVDPVEGVSHASADLAANCLDAAWFIFCDGGLSDHPFHDPLGSPHLYHPENLDNIPVSVRGSCGGSCDPCAAGCLGASNGGGGGPGVAVSPFGALFGCSRCSPMPNASGYDSVALHEFGHVLFKSYNAFLNSGPVSFLNEGLPSGLIEVPLNPSYTPTNPVLFHGKDLTKHLELRNLSLRNTSYGGSPFWYWLAMAYTNIPDSDAEYDSSVHIPEVLRQYAAVIDPGMTVRRMPGRDVILHVQEAFEACHPDGLATPGVDSLTPTCASDDSRGSVPAGFPGWGDYWAAPWDTEGTSEGGHRVGEALMPFVLDLIDQALITHHDMDSDGLAFQAFREFLVANYLNGPAEEVYPDPANPGDPAPEFVDHPYRIKAFGAHYHELDRSAGGWTIELEKGPRMQDWAYHVFYLDGQTAIPYTDWDNQDEASFSVPAAYDRAVAVVTCLESEYPTTFRSYADAGGHYQLTASWYSPRVTHP